MNVTPRTATARKAFLAASALAVAVLLVQLATGLVGSPEAAGYTTLYFGIELLALAGCVLRAVCVRDQRTAWTLIALAVACAVAGDVAWELIPEMTYPSFADALYLAFYPLCCAGMVLLLSRGRHLVAARLWIDGVIGALTVAALTVALLFESILEHTGGTLAQTTVNFAYPIADLLLVGFVLTAFAAQGWQLQRGWVLLGTGAMLTAVADTAFLYQDALGTFRDGSLIDTLWPLGLMCFGWAAWQPWDATSGRRELRWQTFAFPAVFAMLALALLAYGQFARIAPAAALFATAALAVATVRAGLTFRENVRLLHATRAEALTDGLTGLPNRRRLMRDLERALGADPRRHETRPSTFAFFDLDGFKGYNDTYGHAAGDMLLDRLAGRLAATVAGRGRAYRLGGDEFCVLLDGRLPADDALMLACRTALEEQGEGFRVGASCGAVTLHDEADNATHALQLADQRMYAEKTDTRASSRRQTRDVLLQVLREREPELHSHLHGVAALAVAVARELGVSAEQLDEVARAAELHDVGKIAVPDEILHKPGPLDEREWELMRQHTIIGDRILGAAPAMRPVAEIVRASHERFDGSGYPDGLTGTQIPLGSRIVSVCDAFHAMTGGRPYQPTLARDAALAELRRCAGTQFDPAVVDAFVAASARVAVRFGAASAALADVDAAGY